MLLASNYSRNRQSRLCIQLAIGLFLFACVSGLSSHAGERTAQAVPSLPMPFLSEKPSAQAVARDLAVRERNKTFYDTNHQYFRIAEAVMALGKLSTEFSLERNHFELQAFRRSLLPQITPELSVNEDGAGVGRLRIDQVLFDGGRFKAGKKRLNAEQSIAFAEFTLQLNERVANAIRAYLTEYRSKATAELAESISAQYGALSEKARQRLKGGIGDRAEVSVFELKQLEADADSAREQANADIARLELLQLSGIRMTDPPARLLFTEQADVLPPRIALVEAQHQRLSADLRLAKAERLPRLGVRGSVGRGTSLGQGFDDQATSFVVGLSFTQPLTWGRDYGLKAAQSQFESGLARVQEETRDTLTQINSVSYRITELNTQLERMSRLVGAAQQRIENFEDYFLGGAAGIVEAVGIIDSYHRIQQSEIDSRYRLLEAETEKAQLLGVLGPYVVKQKSSH